MIVLILSIILFLVFAILSGFHFYWLFGGTYGVSKVIPTKQGTVPSKQFVPPIATLIVALGLLMFGITYLLKTELIELPIPSWIMSAATWLIPSIFLLRAIGDFNYVGFFKKVKNTAFAKADKQLFSPLCLAIGILGMIVQLLTF